MVLFFSIYVKIKIRKGCEAQMKTIKFILNDDGSIQSSSIGFQINQYSYNDTLINVYVPKELLDNMPSHSEVDEDDSNITYTYSYSFNITILFKISI